MTKEERKHDWELINTKKYDNDAGLFWQIQFVCKNIGCPTSRSIPVHPDRGSGLCVDRDRRKQEMVRQHHGKLIGGECNG